MTTIATDGRSMASDGRCCDGSGIITTDAIQKVYRLSDGSIAGFAGSAFDAPAWLEWLNGDRSGKPEDVWEKAEATILQPDGRVFIYNHHGRCFEAQLPYGTGTGGEFARGAMMAGASPEKAVAIAMKRDSSSGGTITVLHLEPQP